MPHPHFNTKFARKRALDDAHQNLFVIAALISDKEMKNKTLVDAEWDELHAAVLWVTQLSNIGA